MRSPGHKVDMRNVQINFENFPLKQRFMLRWKLFKETCLETDLPPCRKTAKRLLRLRFAGERLQAKKKTKNPGSHEWKSRSGWLCRRMGGFRRLAPVWNNSNTRWVIKIFKVFNLITDIKAFGGGCAQYLNIWALILVLSQHVFGSSRNFIIRGSRICMLSYNLEASGKTNVSKNWRTNGTQWFFL